MQKLFYFFAMAAMVLGMASCGDGNTPVNPIDQQAFTFRLARLGDVAAAVVITPTDPAAEYIIGYVTRDKVWSDEVLANYIEVNRLNGYTYKELVDNYVIMSGERYVAANDLAPNSECVFYACQVDKDLNIINLGIEHVTTLEAGKLQGEFSIDAKGTKVRFSKGNLQAEYRDKTVTNVFRFAENQWDVLGEDNETAANHGSGWIDLHCWIYEYKVGFVDPGTYPITNGGNVANEWFTLSEEQMNYLLYSRERASELMGIGYVKGITGLILLPDNWDGSSLEEDNSFSNREWWEMELKGAVFLPATGWCAGLDNLSAPKEGYYWTSSIDTKSSSVSSLNPYLWLDENGIQMKKEMIIYHKRFAFRLVQYVEK